MTAPTRTISQERELTRRAFLRDVARLGGSMAGLGLLAACAPAAAPAAPSPARMYRVGVLTSVREPMSAFWERMGELGYVEGQNVASETRVVEQETEAPRLADELARLPLDVMVTFGTIRTQAALAATSSMPVVMAAVTDPVGSGFVQSLARPGTNCTGVADAPPEMDLKRLQLLVEAVPTISRVAVLFGGAAAPPLLESWEAAARAVGVELVWLPVTTEDRLEAAAQQAVAEGAEALLVPDVLAVQTGATFTRLNVEGLAERYRLPAMYNSRTWVPRGGLMTYTARRSEIWRRTADYADRVLRGARPADLPVELPTAYDLVVNMRTARALGLTFSRDFLGRVTEVIE